MPDNPYLGRPSFSFWSNAIAESNTLIPSDLYQKKWPISKNEQIATAGSCFAQHIGRHLKHNHFNLMDMEPPPRGLPWEDWKRFGYNTYSARYGNIYTARQLLQLAKEAFGNWSPAEVVWTGENERFYDALRPGVESEGLDSPDEVVAHRKSHLESVRHLFENMDLFIFTLGLTEAWIHTENGTAFPTAPGTIAGSYDPTRYHFKNFSYAEIFQDILEFKEIIHERQIKSRKARFLLTVSPVPLTATASDNHVMVATIYSKSVLRAVAGELSQKYANFDYFPSYEIIANPWSKIFYYEKNLRSVKHQGIEAVMNTFFSAHHESHVGISELEKTTAQTEECLEENMNHTEDVVCEEAILDAFRKE